MRWLDDANRIELLAVVVMPDHLHLVAALCDGSLSHLMHALKGYSARRINDECGKRGPIWQAGYHDCALRDEAAVRAAVGYCLRNPLRAGLVAKVSEYPHLWSRVGAG